MIDYQNVEVRRRPDKSSPSFARMADVLRTWRLLRNRHIKAGPHVVFKEGAEVSICEGGELSIGEHSFFHARSWILLTMPHPRVDLGKWVFVGRNTIIAAKNRISIGDFTVIAPFCYIIDHEHGFGVDDVILNQPSVLKTVQIGRDCYLGAGTVVLGGTTVGDGAVVGAGSVVTRDVPAGEIWAGNPARFIRKRS